MTDRAAPPIDAELDALLEAERHAAPPPDMLGRVWSRIETSSAPSPPGAPGGVANPGPLRVAGTALVIFAAGAAVGAGGHAAIVRHTLPQIVYVDRVVPSAATNPPAPPRATAALSAPSAVAESSVHASLRGASSAVSSLVAERLVLDQARAALVDSDAERALSLLDTHMRRFAKPQLAEEREALTIQTLVVLGRYEDARSRAARFAATSPNSLFFPAIQTSLASIP